MYLCVLPRFLYCPGSISFSPKPARCTDAVSLFWYLIKTPYTYLRVTVSASCPKDIWNYMRHSRGKLCVRLDHKVSQTYHVCGTQQQQKKLSMTSICRMSNGDLQGELINWYRSMDTNSREAALQQSQSNKATQLKGFEQQRPCNWKEVKCTRHTLVLYI